MAKVAGISDNSRRIARNTVFLYIRMVVMLLVGLYTSRVVLNALGQDDFGVYGAVGGVVALFSVLTGAISGAISRFLAFELGKEKSRMQEVFSTTVFVQLALAVIVFILAEVIGLWFLDNKMVIPDGRLDAARLVLHCSVFLFVVNMLSVPYNAAIIAHEKMDAFAYISIVEALLALGAALATRYTHQDKLVVYAVLMLAVAVIVRLIYGVYAGRNFPECRVRLRSVDKGIVKQIGSYSSWTFLGSVASVLNAHGINLLMNIFFGVRVNAARDVTVKLEGNVSRFINNITTAINPQITKSYASGRTSYMHKLVCKGAKYSYLLYFFFALPIILEAPALLQLWLGMVPAHTVPFVRIALLSTLFVAIGTPFVNAIFATGDVKRYEIMASITNVLAFPLSYLAFKMGYPPEVSYWIVAAASLGILAERIVMACKQTGLPFRMVIAEVFTKAAVVTVTAAIVPVAIYLLNAPSTGRMIAVVLASFLMTAVCTWFFGATDEERDAVKVLSGLRRKMSILVATVRYNIFKKPRILKGIRQKDKVNVVFFAVNVGMWKYDGFFSLLQKEERFNPVIVSYLYPSDDKEYQLRVQQQMRTYFESKGYPYYDSFDPATGNWLDVKTLGPDIVFFAQPYDDGYPQYRIRSLWNDCIFAYIPYCYNMEDDAFFYNRLLHNVAWRIFYPTEQHVKTASRHTLTRGRNMVVSGYPMADRLLSDAKPDYGIWKVPNPAVKRVIWAPHHSILPSDQLDYSHFLEIADAMLSLTKEYEGRLQFAFKPHPRLRPKLGQLWGVERTDAYYSSWDNLPNGMFVDGDYVELFRSSDAMVHDCSSFMGEYLFFDKPVMYLGSREAMAKHLNAFAMSCLDNHYMGVGLDDIRRFLDDVVLGGNDPMKPQRDAFRSTLKRDGSVASQLLEDFKSGL